MCQFKKTCSILLCIAILLSAGAVFATPFPNELWVPLEKYEKAMADGNDAVMLENGEKLVEIVEKLQETEQTIQFLSGKYYQLGQCCERLELYDKAVTYFSNYIPYGKKMNEEDGILYANRKITILQKWLHVYVETAPTSDNYYGAKFEPQSGVYFGANYDNDSRILGYDNEKIQTYFPKQNAVYLMYLEFGDDIAALSRYATYLADAKENNAAVELAWNIYQDVDLEKERSYIKETIDYLNDTKVKIFLRFGAEMNTMDSITNADAYIDAFRYVSQYAKTKDNIAVVWSPSDIGAINKPFEMFYPGDEYVDWIGVSFYTMPYFQGKKSLGENADALNTFFMTGDYANPLLRLKPITDFMKEKQIKKPLMLSEYGVAHFVRQENEDRTWWAGLQMRKIHGELLREYPQIKLMCYFNVVRPNEANDYALYDNPSMNELYNQLVADPYFVSAVGENSGFSYQLFGKDTYAVGQRLAISSSAYYPKKDSLTLRYYLDGNELYSSNISPYAYQLSLENSMAGEHVLAVEAYDGDKKMMENSYDFYIENRSIKVFLNGTKVQFADQQPVQVNDRTMIPIRGLFEAIGAIVDWDESTNTAIVQKDGATISIQADANEMQVSDENGIKKIGLDVSVRKMNDRIMIPLRAILEALGATVEWDENEGSVMIHMNNEKSAMNFLHGTF